MPSTVAWLLDLFPEGADVWTYWVTLGTEPHLLRLKIGQPLANLYAVPGRGTCQSVVRGLMSHPAVKQVHHERRRVSIHDWEQKDAWQLQVPLSLVTEPQLIRSLRDCVPLTFYNTDLSLHQYLYEKSGLFPFCKTKVRYEGSTLTGYEVLDSLTAFNYEPPPVQTIKMDVVFDSAVRKQVVKEVRFTSLSPTPTSHQPRPTVITNPSERTILLEAVGYVQSVDPDIIVTQGGDTDLRMLARRATELGLGHLTLSREIGVNAFKHIGKVEAQGTSFMSYGGHYYKDHALYLKGGRLHVDLRNSFTWTDGGFAGMVELARMSCIDPQRSARASIGTSLTGMQIRQALDLGILIPTRKADPEAFRSGESLLTGDRGGFIYAPRPGLHFNVASVDYTSMFPQIMVLHNISPETVNCQCCRDGSGRPIPGTNAHTCSKREGLVPLVLRGILQKRLHYKKHRHESKAYDQLQKTLKWILVTSFGYQGYRNARFGRIEGHEAINAHARVAILQAGEVVREAGLEVVAGIVDSIWAKFPQEQTVPDELPDRLCQRIEELTGLPISHDGVFRWIVFLPRREEPEVGVLNRYYGCFMDGSFKVRGIEVRRKDTCAFIKEAQTEALEVLARATTHDEFKDLLETDFWVVYRTYRERLVRREVCQEELVITKVLSQDPFMYRQMCHQAIAGQQLVRAGARIQAGMKVRYLVTNARSNSMNKRVVPLELMREDQPYDRRWYQKMLREAFDNIIPPAFTPKRIPTGKLQAYLK